MAVDRGYEADNLNGVFLVRTLNGLLELLERYIGYSIINIWDRDLVEWPLRPDGHGHIAVWLENPVNGLLASLYVDNMHTMSITKAPHRFIIRLPKETDRDFIRRLPEHWAHREQLFVNFKLPRLPT